MRISKRILLFLWVAILAMNLQSKGKDVYACQLVLASGESLNGFMQDAKIVKHGQDNLRNMVSVNFSSTKDGQPTTYKAEDIKEMYLTIGTERHHFISAYALKSMTMPKNLKSGSKKYLWYVVYEGKNVYGLASESSDSYAYQNGRAISFETTKTTTLSFLDKKTDVVVSYYQYVNGFSIGQKKFLKMCFERYPKMVDYINSSDFKLKALKDDPNVLVKKLDALY